MWIDYHTHHARCGHAAGELEEYVLRGIELGLKQLGLSDHMPLIHVDPAKYYEGMAMPLEEFPRYVEECLELKEKYRDRIDIRVGVEADYIEGYEEDIAKLLEPYPWDYVIGSVHFLGEWDVTDFRQLHNWEGKDVDEVYAQYYDAVQKAARTGLYDYIGHIDVIKRFGQKPTKDVYDLEKQTLDAVKEAGLAIELNASGLRMPAAEMFPSRRMLEYCLAEGIPLTVGSDAHDPTKLAQYLDQAYALLKDLGFTELATFDRRRRIMVPIE
ncbi:putative histidinol-phosphatase [Insulibacter thermoxylanivorax]|uniref:Histidinol-phosphatase n=1 Tax=Insulibacter thermoxylanivorax TaxID=2749268 RepID=A0A916QF37_9BACL|nr:histidinol-phosphatase HisJ [Insulibacter thermoxylanivorax]GFR38459.1 putative histidinol-phosphatase [Insulibacter thermoxylanivorax]